MQTPPPGQDPSGIPRSDTPWLRRLWPLAMAGVMLAYLLAYPLALGRADESHLLHGARRVLAGEVLYKDFFEIITPLGFYLFAAIYRVAGTTLYSARVTMALIEVVGALALFRLTTRVAGRLEAVLAVLVLLVLCIPVWPYASPHWISTTLTVLTAGVVLDPPWRRPWAQPLVAGLLSGVAICTQQQRGVLLAAWLPLAYAVLAGAQPPGHRWRTAVRQTTWAAGGAVLVSALVLGYAAWAASPKVFIEMVIGFAASNYPTGSILAWASILPLTGDLVSQSWHWLLQIAPVFPIIETVLLVRRRPWGDAERARACLVLLAACMVLAVVYLPDAIHVAFVLPFLLAPAFCLLHDLRSWLRARGGQSVRLAGAGVWVLAGILVAKGAANVDRAWQGAPARYQTAFGTLETTAEMEELYRAVDRHLVVEPDGQRRLYSFPADAWLFLALGATASSRFDILVPGQFPPAYVEEVTETVRARRPGTIVLFTGWRAGEIGDAVTAGYDLVEEVGMYRVYVRRPTIG